jgi:hypothetical protein
VITIEIRPATEADLPAVVALLADDDLGARRESPGDPTPYRAAFAAIDADPSELLVVAVREGTVAGTLQLSLLPGLSRRGALRGQIEGVRVGRSLGHFAPPRAVLTPPARSPRTPHGRSHGAGGVRAAVPGCEVARGASAARARCLRPLRLRRAAPRRRTP